MNIFEFNKVDYKEENLIDAFGIDMTGQEMNAMLNDLTSYLRTKLKTSTNKEAFEMESSQARVMELALNFLNNYPKMNDNVTIFLAGYALGRILLSAKESDLQEIRTRNTGDEIKKGFKDLIKAVDRKASKSSYQSSDSKDDYFEQFRELDEKTLTYNLSEESKENLEMPYYYETVRNSLVELKSKFKMLKNFDLEDATIVRSKEEADPEKDSIFSNTDFKTYATNRVNVHSGKSERMTKEESWNSIIVGQEGSFSTTDGIPPSNPSNKTEDEEIEDLINLAKKKMK